MDAMIAKCNILLRAWHRHLKLAKLYEKQMGEIAGGTRRAGSVSHVGMKSARVPSGRSRRNTNPGSNPGSSTKP